MQWRLNGSGEASVDGIDAERVEDEAATDLFGAGDVCWGALRMGWKADKLLVYGEEVPVCTVAPLHRHRRRKTTLILILCPWRPFVLTWRRR